MTKEQIREIVRNIQVREPNASDRMILRRFRRQTGGIVYKNAFKNYKTGIWARVEFVEFHGRGTMGPTLIRIYQPDTGVRLTVSVPETVREFFLNAGYRESLVEWLARVGVVYEVRYGVFVAFNVSGDPDSGPTSHDGVEMRERLQGLHVAVAEVLLPDLLDAHARAEQLRALVAEVEEAQLYDVVEACTNVGRWPAIHTGSAVFVAAPLESPRRTGLEGKFGSSVYDEPRRVAEAAAAMGLRYDGVTSVVRDDRADGGAELFVLTIFRPMFWARIAAPPPPELGWSGRFGEKFLSPDHPLAAKVPDSGWFGFYGTESAAIEAVADAVVRSGVDDSERPKPRKAIRKLTAEEKLDRRRSLLLAAALDPATPRARLKELADGLAPLAAVLDANRAANPATTARTIRRIYQRWVPSDRQPEGDEASWAAEAVRQAVAGNPRTPPEILLAAGAYYPRLLFCNPAYRELSNQDPDIWKWCIVAQIRGRLRRIGDYLDRLEESSKEFGLRPTGERVLLEWWSWEDLSAWPDLSASDMEEDDMEEERRTSLVASEIWHDGAGLWRVAFSSEGDIFGDQMSYNARGSVDVIVKGKDGRWRSEDQVLKGMLRRLNLPEEDETRRFHYEDVAFEMADEDGEIRYKLRSYGKLRPYGDWFFNDSGKEGEAGYWEVSDDGSCMDEVEKIFADEFSIDSEPFWSLVFPFDPRAILEAGFQADRCFGDSWLSKADVHLWRPSLAVSNTEISFSSARKLKPRIWKSRRPAKTAGWRPIVRWSAAD